MCLQLRLRLPFLVIFLLGINCLFFVRYNTYRTFQVHCQHSPTMHPAGFVGSPTCVWHSATQLWSSHMPELCSMQVTWLGLTPLYLAESTAVVCWLLLLSPGPPGKHQPLLDLLEVSSSACLRGSHLRRPSIQ